MKDLSEYCTSCKMLHPAKRVENEGELRFLSINRLKSVSGTTLKSMARLDMKDFNVISCSIHFW